MMGVAEEEGSEVGHFAAGDVLPPLLSASVSLTLADALLLLSAVSWQAPRT